MKAKALVLGCGAVAVAAALFSHGAAAQSAVTDPNVSGSKLADSRVVFSVGKTF